MSQFTFKNNINITVRYLLFFKRIPCGPTVPVVSVVIVIVVIRFDSRNESDKRYRGGGTSCTSTLVALRPSQTPRLQRRGWPGANASRLLPSFSTRLGGVARARRIDLCALSIRCTAGAPCCSRCFDDRRWRAVRCGRKYTENA